MIWKLRTTVKRLSAPGKAISLKIPLLPNESVLTSNVVINSDIIDANLGANQSEFTWESEIPPTSELQLEAIATEQWVERWYLMTSPVWNVTFERLSPIHESMQGSLVPVWRPWPGEGVTLHFQLPDAVSGQTTTVQQVFHETQIGPRLRTMSLQMDVESSLGRDFVIDFNVNASVVSLMVDNQSIPIQRNGSKLTIPLQPGKQSVEVNWTTPELLGTVIPIGGVEIPVEGSNVTTVMRVPEHRWVLWANGPLRGPAVRFWTILASAILLALVLGNFSLSPLRRFEWILLAIGLTQIHVAAGMVVVGWLFLLAWRGKQNPQDMGYWRFGLLQILLVILTFMTLGIFVIIVGEGLLGNPNMFIVGNGSSQTYLNWFQPSVESSLP
ncbi:MAG: hypothetical protein N2C14_02705, partial [Planctomycetales bacterium]